MKRTLYLIAGVQAVCAQQEAVIPEAACRQDCQQNALSFAYAYGYPLYSYGKYVNPAYRNASTNTLYHSRRLATADDTAVVRPNSDTLYSTSFFDVSANDVELQVPEFGDRYWVWPMYDMYGNDLANIGSLTNSSAGKYLLRFDSGNPGVQTDDLKGDYKAYLNLPTPYGISLPRILVENTANDTETVNSLQDQLNMTLVLRSDPPVAPALNLSIFAGPEYTTTLNTTSVARLILKLTAQLAPYNKPYIAYDRSWVRQTLQNAGIDLETRTFSQPLGTNLTAAIATADASNEALQTTPGLVLRLGNSWTARASRVSGAFGSFYTARFSTAMRGYLALISEQVIYPAISDFNITADQALLFRFTRKPELKKGGFWSLTLYGADQYLIKNDLNRYAIGDRSNLTFPDGTPLSNKDKDGPFEILCQANDVPPPSNWTSNWLPTTSGGGTIKVTLRLYGAEDAMKNGDWVYPNVTVIDAKKG